MKAVYNNYLRYLKYDSILNERNYDHYESKVRNISTAFPIVIACANSVHSLSKVKNRYGHILTDTSFLKKGITAYFSR